MSRVVRLLMLLGLVSAVVACGKEGSDPPTTPTPVPTIPYDTLSEYGLFAGNMADLVPADGVVPYAPISPLYSDYADKHRFMRVPDGATITYDDAAPWDYPEGTILIKSFGYLNDMRDPNQGGFLLETRLLIRTGADFEGYTYVWNADQTEAFRTKAGKRIPISWIDGNGATIDLEYRVPNENQCMSCHGDEGETFQIGPRTRQLNADFDYGAGPVNQIDHLNDLGLLDVAPPPVGSRPTLVDPMGAADVESRARSYLDANCAHCHNRDSGFAISSGLYLDYDTSNPSEYGICRTPSAAGTGNGGHTFDIVPGFPDDSVLIYRMVSTEPEGKMPEIGVTIPHAEGVAVISDWITQITPPGCN